LRPSNFTRGWWCRGWGWLQEGQHAKPTRETLRTVRHTHDNGERRAGGSQWGVKVGTSMRGPPYTPPCPRTDHSAGRCLTSCPYSLEAGLTITGEQCMRAQGLHAAPCRSLACTPHHPRSGYCDRPCPANVPRKTNPPQQTGALCRRFTANRRRLLPTTAIR